MNKLISGLVWGSLKQFAKENHAVADVAVAYFGKGGSKLLPLPKGSRLVVDASEGAVKQGQTHPDDLLVMQNRGVRVFSMPNLHAKVYVFSKRAYIGSANVSQHSANTLIEALFRTTDPDAVRQAKQFVRDQCRYELPPGVLRQLQRVYHPPKWEAGQPRTRSQRQRAALPRVCLAQLVRQDWTEEDEREAEAGAAVAEKERIHEVGWAVERFRWTGTHPFRKGDMVLQVTTEPDGRVMVSPPGSLLHVHSYPRKRGRGNLLYVEVPEHQRRRPLEKLAKRFGRGAKKMLRINGVIRNRALAERLLSLSQDWGPHESH